MCCLWLVVRQGVLSTVGGKAGCVVCGWQYGRVCCQWLAVSQGVLSVVGGNAGCVVCGWW